VRILLDTNIVLDVLQARAGFVDDAAAIFERVERNVATGLLCATTITTLAYLVSKSLGRAQGARHIRKLLSLFEVAPVNRAVLDAALGSKQPDFEDAVLAEAARLAEADAIITRNLRDFAHSPVRAYTPAQWLAMLGDQ
jgi:predicted nucleic acid-binding protein